MKWIKNSLVCQVCGYVATDVHDLIDHYKYTEGDLINYGT